MSDNLLKGNFKVKREVKDAPAEALLGAEAIAQQLKQRALANLGGSMIYVDRTVLDWDPDQEAPGPKRPPEPFRGKRA